MYFMSDPQALHVTRNVIPGKLGVDLHLHRVHIPLVKFCLQCFTLLTGILTGHRQGSWFCKILTILPLAYTICKNSIKEFLDPDHDPLQHQNRMVCC